MDTAVHHPVKFIQSTLFTYRGGDWGSSSWDLPEAPTLAQDLKPMLLLGILVNHLVDTMNFYIMHSLGHTPKWLCVLIIHNP